MLLLVVALILLERVFLVEELACPIEVTRDPTNVASVLFSFKPRLAVVPGIVASEDFEDGLRLACRDLAILGNYALFDLLVGLREERSRAEIHEVRLHIAEDAIIQVIHEIKYLSFLGEFSIW